MDPEITIDQHLADLGLSTEHRIEVSDIPHEPVRILRKLAARGLGHISASVVWIPPDRHATVYLSELPDDDAGVAELVGHADPLVPAVAAPEVDQGVDMSVLDEILEAAAGQHLDTERVKADVAAELDATPPPPATPIPVGPRPAPAQILVGGGTPAAIKGSED